MPYIVGHPIKDPAHFYGRDEEVSRFYEVVAGTQAQSMSVLGMRRSGKTSFMHYVSHRDTLRRHLAQPQRYVMIYLDMSFCKTPTAFYQRLQACLHDALRERELAGPRGARLAPPERANMYEVEDLLRQFPKQRVIFLIDEFDQMRRGHFDDSFLVELRALTSAMDYELATVTASYWDLPDLGTFVGLPPTSPFFNIFYPTPIHLSGLRPGEADELIRTPAMRANISYKDEEVADIISLAGTIPFFIQATASRWFGERKSGRRAAKEAIQAQLVQVLGRYYGQWWRQLDQPARDLLTTAAAGDQNGHRGLLNRLRPDDTARRLVQFGLLDKSLRGYTINGEIFAAWIRSYADRVPLDELAVSEPNADPAELRRALVDRFNMDELRMLSFDLGVDFEDLAGSSKSAKATALVGFCQRTRRLQRLADAIRRERGD